MKMILLLLLFVITPNVSAQLKTYTFEEAEALSKESPKPFVIFTHTSWCKFCRMMENSTFKNDKITEMLNDSFYFITLDAENKEPIVFNRRIFKFVPNGNQTGIHQLAAEFSDQSESKGYPLLTILDSEYLIIFQKMGYINSDDLLLTLNQIIAAD